MVRAYRSVLSLPGAALFSATGLIARLPMSMIGLGIVLLVTDQTGSYALAGSITGVSLIGNAIAAVLLGRLMDRLGQRRLLITCALVWAASLLALVVAVRGDAAIPIPHLCAFIAGAAFPPVGSAVRTRWTHVARDADEKQTAFAVEAVADEVVFVVGPVLVTVLATAVHPVAGLATALVAGLIGMLALAGQRRTEPAVVVRALGEAAVPLSWRRLLPVAIVSASVGIVFGATEVAAVAFADERDARAASGVLLALWSLGSLVAGVASGAVRWRVAPEVRVRRGALSLAALMLPLPLIDGLVLLGGTLFLIGLTIAPTLIALVAAVEGAVDRSRLNEGLAVVHTAMMIGVGGGAAVAGWVADAAGSSWALGVPGAAGLVGGCVAVLLRSDRPGRDPHSAVPERDLVSG